MGNIIKNRSGSISKNRLEEIFEEGMNVHLKILNSFFEIIRDKDRQEGIIEFMSSRIALEIEKKGKEFTSDEVEKLSKSMFWKLNFGVVYSSITKIVHSLGSNKLLNIMENVCNKYNTPATDLIKHGILMWHNKNLQIENVANCIESNHFSETAKQVMNHKVVEHCSMHQVDYRVIQKVENKLKISAKAISVSKFKYEK